MNIGLGPRRNGKLKKRAPGPSALRRANSANAGFGVSPPLRRQTSFVKDNKEQSIVLGSTSVHGRSSSSGKTTTTTAKASTIPQLLQDAEQMVRIVLQNPTETLSADSIHRVVTQFGNDKKKKKQQQHSSADAALLDNAKQLVRVALDSPKERLTVDALRKATEQVTSMQRTDGSPTRNSSRKRSGDGSSENTTAQQQLLEDSQRLVRLLLGKPSELLSSASVHKAMEQVSQQQTSKRYRFLLEKPWRTTTSGYDDSSHTTDFFSEHNESTSPQRKFHMGNRAHSSVALSSAAAASATATSDILVDQLSQTQKALEQARSRIRRLEELEARSGVPSNESLGSIGDVVAVGAGGDSSSDSQVFLISKVNKLEAQMAEAAQDHQREVDSLQQKLKASTKQLEEANASFESQLEGVHLDHKVKMSAIERKLADSDRSFQEATKRLDYVEKNLAQTELDRRLKVSSLEKKIERMTQEQGDAKNAAELEAAVQRLQEEVTQLETERGDLVATHETYLSRIQEDHEAETTSLESKLYVLSGQVEQVEAKDQRIQVLEQAVAEAAIRHLENQRTSQASIESLNSEIETWKNAAQSQSNDTRVHVLETESTALSAKLADSEKAVKGLNERISSLTAENISLSAQVTESERRVQDLETEKKSFPSKLHAMDERLHSTEPSKSRGTVDCDELAANSGGCESRLNVGELWERLNDAEARLKGASASAEQPREVPTGTCPELTSARLKVDEYLTKIKEMEETNVQLSRQTRALGKGRDVLRDCLLRAKRSVQEMSCTAGDVPMEGDRGEVRSFVTTEKNVEETEEEIASQFTEQLNDLRVCLENQTTTLKTEYATAGKELAGVKEATAQFRRELELRENQILEDQLTIKELRRNLEEKIKLLSENESCFESQMGDLSTSVDMLQTELKNKEIQLQETAMKADIAVSDSLSKVTVLEKLLVDTEGRLESSEEELKASVAKYARLEEATDRLKAKRRDFQSKEAELVALKNTAATWDAEKQELNNRALSLERDLSVSKERINQLEIEATSVPMMSEELSRVKVSLHDMAVELQQAKESNFDLQQQSTSLMNQRDQLTRNITQTEQNIRQLKGENDSLQRNLSDLETAQAREQELLSDELRESEVTIASLLEELELLKPLAGDLERAESALEEAEASTTRFEMQIKELSSAHDRKVSTMEKELSSTKEEIEQLRDELLPLTRELQQANRELAEVRNQTNALANGGEADNGLVGSLGLLQEDVIALRTELSDSGEALARAQARNSELTEKHQGEVSKLSSELLLISDECDRLRCEVNELKPKLAGADCREAEYAALKLETEDKDKQLNSCRLQLQAMEEEQNYSRARIAELSDLAHSKDNPDKTLREKANECANLRAERDTLRQKLTVVEAMATALEQDNKQKKLFFQQLISKNGTPEDTAEAFIESLQTELERTLKRCADLSLQLADSQFRITELTESVRRLKKAPPPHTQSNSLGGGSFHFGRAQSFDSPKGKKRRSISTILTNSMAAMDESLRGATGGTSR